MNPSNGKEEINANLNEVPLNYLSKETTVSL